MKTPRGESIVVVVKQVSDASNFSRVEQDAVIRRDDGKQRDGW